MRAFFSGWSRKVGCITLVMALACSVGWVRSFFLCDVLVFNSRDPLFTTHTVISEGQWLGLQYSQLTSEVDDIPRQPFLGWGSGLRHPLHTDLLEIPGITWRSYGGIFKVGEVRGQRTKLWLAPYWSIVIPLTLISACLILGKPRSKASSIGFQPVIVPGNVGQEPDLTT